jgi:methylmalonyl-CoA mutase C-terminal domain/subunit
VPRVVEQLKEAGGDRILVFVGGIIPAEDIKPLKQAGVMDVFTPGSSTSQIADAITRAVEEV